MTSSPPQRRMPMGQIENRDRGVSQWLFLTRLLVGQPEDHLNPAGGLLRQIEYDDPDTAAGRGRRFSVGT